MESPSIVRRDVDGLCPCVRALHRRFLDKAERRGVRVTTIETLRSEPRQRHLMEIGASRTLRSYHLPQKPNGLALAFDVAPTEYLTLKAWNPHGIHWQTLGEIGRWLGMEWGGDWEHFKDLVHFQRRACTCEQQMEAA